MKKYVLIIDNASWMSAHKAWPFIDAAKDRGYCVIRVAPDMRFSRNEEVFILDPISCEEILFEKIKSYEGQIDFVFSSSDISSAFIANIASQLGAHFFTAELAQHLSTKLSLSKLLQHAGEKGPQSWMIKKIEDFDLIPDSMALIVKPNVSTGGTARHGWDYRRFSNRQALTHYLKESGNLSAFIKNYQQQERYQSFVQEWIEADQFLDVHMIFAESGRYETFLIGEFSTHPGDVFIVESKTAVNVSPDLKKQIDRIGSFFSQKGYRFMVGNLQFALKDGTLFLFDFNLRVAGIWSYLYKLMMPDFYDRMVRFFQGEAITFSLRHPYYLKTPYYLHEGQKIRTIEVPVVEDPDILLAYTDHLVPNYRVPDRQNSIQPAPQIFAVGDSEESCRNKISKVLRNTKTEYY